MGFSLTPLFLYDTDSSIFFFSHSPTGTAKSPNGRNGSLFARCPVWQGAVFYVILGWVLQSQQSFLVCKWHCVHGLAGPAGQQRPRASQKKRHKWRLISKGRESSGEMEMVRGLSRVVSLSSWRSCLRRKTGPEQCLGHVQKALQSFRQLCAVHSSAVVCKDVPVTMG